MKLSLIPFFLLSCLFVQTMYSQHISPKHILNPSSYGQKKLRKAPKKIFINHFNIYYQTEAIGKAQDNSAKDGVAVAQMNVQLNGLSPSLLQEITDQVYQEFTQSLKDHGFTLLNTDQAAETKFFQGSILKEGAQMIDNQLEGYVLNTPNHFSYFIRKETKSGKQRGNSHVVLDRTVKLSKQLDDAIIADVVFVLPFSSFYAKSPRH